MLFGVCLVPFSFVHWTHRLTGNVINVFFELIFSQKPYIKEVFIEVYSPPHNARFYCYYALHLTHSERMELTNIYHVGMRRIVIPITLRKKNDVAISLLIMQFLCLLSISSNLLGYKETYSAVNHGTLVQW